LSAQKGVSIFSYGETMRKTNSPIYFSLPCLSRSFLYITKTGLLTTHTHHFYLIEKRNKTGGGGDSKIGEKDEMFM
jgi:hypothetical protein